MNPFERFVDTLPGFVVFFVLAIGVVVGAVFGAVMVVPLTHDDAGYVVPRAERYYGDRGFSVVGAQGYSMMVQGRCYWYTLRRDGLLYQSCLLKWGDGLHEYNLSGVGVPALEQRR